MSVVTLDLPLTLGAIDGLVATYLLAWALRRERRDKPAVAIVGGVLAVCAAFLLFVALVDRAPARPRPPASPSPSTAPATTAV